MSDCPPRSDLERLLLGELDEKQVVVVEAHVEQCAECCEVIESLCNDEVTDQWQAWWQQVNHPANILDRLDRYEVKEELGAGGFGAVYRCFDRVLRQDVAIKVPHRHRAIDVEAYLDEASKWLRLDHPGVARFLHADRLNGSCFVVSRFIQGCTLKDRIRQSRPSFTESAAIVAQVARALHHVHHQRLYHRDIKPSNILLDVDGMPFLTDFGMALSEDEVGTGSKWCGTLHYQSPEQAKGEGHLVDGRADVYSLGVVLYELLTGELPFDAQTNAEVRELIIRREARPMRAIDDCIPMELERICLKALSKRITDRYTTARDFAQELERWQEPRPASWATTIRPKGLRSFEEEDADFFLGLLPGPRHRDGLPESIHFWKSRIEQTDSEETLRVGLISGPSGCGKSSLVKAGLLPRLAAHVHPIYVEADTTTTETRLLKALRRACPDMPPEIALVESVAAVRTGRASPVGQKILIVLDQFEQWLQAKASAPGAQLVQAIRQCDGQRVQCIIMVRDDFATAVGRFMHQLEVRIAQYENFTTFDLFDLNHARMVLAEFGRAYQRLPDNVARRSGQHEQFLDQSVRGLAEDGMVTPVRLALFAHMVKNRDWSPTTLNELGGIEGIGVKFLDEAFSKQYPEYLGDTAAARSVLKALLPPKGTNIRGKMQPRTRLLRLTEYEGREDDFDRLIAILDDDLRLVTPTEPERLPLDHQSGPQSTAREIFYQLTHDFMVPPVRAWLTRAQQGTWRGRAELCLEERTAQWVRGRERRFVPSALEYVQIQAGVPYRYRAPAQREMMKAAYRLHLGRLLAIAACLAVILGATYETFVRLKTDMLVSRLLEAKTPDVPDIIAEINSYRWRVIPKLRAALKNLDVGNAPTKELHLRLALLATDQAHVGPLYRQLLRAGPEELLVIREALRDHQPVVCKQLWHVLIDKDQEHTDNERLRAACALAVYAPSDARWKTVCSDVLEALAKQRATTLGQWSDALLPVGRNLLPPLVSSIAEGHGNTSERQTTISLYSKYAEKNTHRANDLAARLPDFSDQPKMQANVAVALLLIGQAADVWPLLRATPDPSVRSHIIDMVGMLGVAPKTMIDRLEREPDVSVRRAILLSLGGYPTTDFTLTRRRQLVTWVAQLYSDDPDAGVHAAAEWLLRQWKQDKRLRDLALPTEPDRGNRRWYVTQQGHTMVIVNANAENEGSYAIGSKEVTMDQLLAMKPGHEYNRELAPEGNCPAIMVSWYQAAEYCNRLGQLEGLDQTQWCYEPNGDGDYAEGMRLAQNFLERSGYRLPTEAEWTYACRAGASSQWCYGNSEQLLSGYAWYYGNTGGTYRTFPVGALKPNDFGLFDVHGNAREWCLDVRVVDSTAHRPSVHHANQIDDKRDRLLMGGSTINQAADVGFAVRAGRNASSRLQSAGFRLLRVLQ